MRFLTNMRRCQRGSQRLGIEIRLALHAGKASSFLHISIGFRLYTHATRGWSFPMPLNYQLYETSNSFILLKTSPPEIQLWPWCRLDTEELQPSGSTVLSMFWRRKGQAVHPATVLAIQRNARAHLWALGEPLKWNNLQICQT